VKPTPIEAPWTTATSGFEQLIKASQKGWRRSTLKNFDPFTCISLSPANGRKLVRSLPPQKLGPFPEI